MRKTLFFTEFPRKKIVVPKHNELTLCGVIASTSGAPRRMIISLEGIAARVNCIFVYIGKGESIATHEVLIRHTAPDTVARFRSRSILTDSSRHDIRGILQIGKRAVHADTYFSHHALLLSSNARARAIPSLEIETDDVKAGHATTVGPLSEDALSYLHSRGLGKYEATRLLMHGFVIADASYILDPTIREQFLSVCSKEVYDLA